MSSCKSVDLNNLLVSLLPGSRKEQRTFSIKPGEVLCIRIRGDEEDSAVADIDRVRRRLDVVDPDWPLISEAAKVKAHGGLSYADAVCLASCTPGRGAPLDRRPPRSLTGRLSIHARSWTCALQLGESPRGALRRPLQRTRENGSASIRATWFYLCSVRGIRRPMLP